MKIVTIVQARTGSSRLPGKVLLDLSGAPMLTRVVERARQCATDATVIATSTAPGDDAVEDLADTLGVACFRGSEEDVLARFVGAARVHGADAIVRITADCPLLDPAVTNSVIRAFIEAGVDFASNALERSFPRGLDSEVFSRAALERACAESQAPYERAHVTPYLYALQNGFRLAPVTLSGETHARHRWTVDTPEDLTFVRAVYDRVGPNTTDWRTILEAVEAEPSLTQINALIHQKHLEEG